MGLFGSKKKTVRGVSISRLIEDDSYKNPASEGVYDAVTSGSDLAATIRSHVTGSYFRKYEHIYNYASKGKYTFGSIEELDVKENTEAQIRIALQQYVDSQLGSGWTLQDYQIDIPNHLLFYYKVIQDSYGFSSATNQGTHHSIAMYLQDIQLNYGTSFADAVSASLLNPIGNPATGGQTYTRTRDMSRPHTPYVIVSDEDLVSGLNFATSTWIYRETLVTTTTSAYTRAAVEDEWELVDTSTVITGELPTLPNTSMTQINYTSNTAIVSETATEKVTLTSEVEVNKYTYTLHYNFPRFLTSEEDHEWLVEADGDNFEPDAETVQSGMAAVEYISMSAVNAAGETEVLLYIIDSGEAYIDDVLEIHTSLDIGEYYPRIYLRYDGVKMNKEKNTKEFRSSKRAVKYLGLDYSSFIDDIHEAVGSVGDVKHMYLQTCVTLEDMKNSPLLREYGFRLLETYFKTYAEVGSNSTGQINLAFTDKKTHSTFSVSNIIKQTGQSTEPNGFYLLEHERAVPIVYMGTVRFEAELDTELRFVKDGKYTSYMLIDWKVHLRAEGNNYTGLGSKEPDRYLILDRAVLRNSKFTMPEKNEIVAKSINLVFITVKVVKKKWYQRGIFKAVLVIAGAVISALVTVGTGGTGAPSAAAFMKAVLVSVAVSVVVGVVIQIAVRLLVKLGLDPRVAAVVVIVAAIYTGFISVTDGGGTITAKSVIKAVNSAYDVYNVGQQMELKQAAKYYEGQMENLSKMQDKLDDLQAEFYKNQSLLEIAAYNYTRNLAVGEGYDDFIERTTLVSAVDVTLDYISYYVDIQLNLNQAKSVKTIWEESINGQSI